MTKDLTPPARPHTSQILWIYVLSGFFVLFGAAYYDNIRGPLLPVISRQLDLSHSTSSWFLVVGHLAAVVCTSSISSALNRFSERAVTTATCLLGIASGLAALAVHDVVSLMVLAAIIGATTSSMGAMCNILVIEGTPTAHQGRMLAGLHTMYGVGSIFAATTVAEALANGVGWPYIVLGPAPVVLAFIVFLRLRLRPNPLGIRREPRRARLSKLQVAIILVFCAYVAGEVVTSMWLPTYLVERHGLTAAQAARYATAFFAMMTLTRFACFAFIRPRFERNVIIAALALPIVAFILGLAGLPLAFAFVGLVGPFFPLFLARVSRNFPDNWRSLTVWIMVSVQIVLIVAHLTLGRAADLLTISRAYTLGLALLVATLASVLAYFRLEQSHPK